MARPKGSKNKVEKSPSDGEASETTSSLGTETTQYLPDSPKVDVPDLVLDKRPEAVTSEGLLQQLEEVRKKNQELESKWQERELKEKKERDPMSGPGKPCQAYKITVAESWQLGKEVVNMPDGRPEMRLKKCPEGYQVRKGTNGYYIVGLDDPKPEKNEYISNCRSKYTTEHEYKMRKPATFKIDQEPPKGKVHLCEHHAHVLLKKGECWCKFCKPKRNEV